MLGLIPWRQFSYMPTCTSEWIPFSRSLGQMLSRFLPRPLYACTRRPTLVAWQRGGLCSERTWGDTRLVVGRRDGRATRMVVRLTKKYIPGALALHPQENGDEPKALDQLEVGTLVLWDAVS